MSNIELVPLNFSITINANVETVWHKMLDLESYKIWTTEFDKASYYEGSWDLGASIVFKALDEESGMSAIVTQNEYLKVVELTIQNWIAADGEIDTSSEESKAINGTVERYNFTAISDNETRIDVFTETLESFSEFLNQRWPKALQKLKQICE